MNLGEYIKEYRQKNDLSMQEFADRANLSKGYISMLEKGKHPQSNRDIIPSLETINKVASAVGKSADELLSILDSDQPIDISRKSFKLPSNLIVPSCQAIPILGSICAGDGIICDESFEGFFYIDRSIKADYCLLVQGDSMIDSGIFDGDIAFIKKDYEFREGNIYAVVIMPENEATLKKVYFADEKAILQPSNDYYSPIIVDPCEMYIVGECIGSYHGR